MKSLRTDDIIGATPRVRHMPKNYIRQHLNYPTTNLSQFDTQKDYQRYYQSLGGKWDHSYNSNLYGNFPLSQYDPNPFEKQQMIYRYEQNQQRPNLNQTNKSNYSNQNNQPNYQKNDKPNGSHYRKFNQNSKQRQNLIQNREIKKKQAQIINYQQVKQLEKIRNQMKSSNVQIEQSRSNPQQSNSAKADLKSNEIKKSFVNESFDARSSQQSRARSSLSMSNDKSSQKKQKNIFRGLGFNIITNSKYQFNLETQNPYIKRNYD